MTAQIKEILIYNKEELFIACEPLESYLDELKLPHKLIPPSTACWRGYNSKWVIDNKKLFLIDLEGYIEGNYKVGMDYLFPGEEIVFAQWFTGEIRIDIGDVVAYFYRGYDHAHEGEKFLVFDNGVMVDEYIKWLSQEEILRLKKEEEERQNLPF